MMTIEDLKELVKEEARDAAGPGLANSLRKRGVDIQPLKTSDLEKVLDLHPWKAVMSGPAGTLALESKKALSTEGKLLCQRIDEGVHISYLHIFEWKGSFRFLEERPYILPSENVILLPAHHGSSIASLEYKTLTVGAPEKIEVEPGYDQIYTRLLDAENKGNIESPALPA